MDAHAQLEIRQYAETMGREIVAPLLPLVWEAFLDYRVEGMTLTRLEQAVIARLAAAGKMPADEAGFHGRRRSDLGRSGPLPRTRRMPRETRAIGNSEAMSYEL